MTLNTTAVFGRDYIVPSSVPEFLLFKTKISNFQNQYFQFPKPTFLFFLNQYFHFLWEIPIISYCNGLIHYSGQCRVGTQEILLSLGLVVDQLLVLKWKYWFWKVEILVLEIWNIGFEKWKYWFWKLEILVLKLEMLVLKIRNCGTEEGTWQHF